jgi:single-stranded DNA-binding protein
MIKFHWTPKDKEFSLDATVPNVHGRARRERGNRGAEFHRCIWFGKLADFAATLKKGAHVQVGGELLSRE